MLIPLTVMKDIDGCGYYGIAENMNIKGYQVLNGTIVDRKDISVLAEPPVRVPLQTKEGHYGNLVSALSALENQPEIANALLFNPEDVTSISSKQEIYGTPCRLKRLEIGPIFRLRVSFKNEL
jgi:hypothetical protein